MTAVAPGKRSNNGLEVVPVGENGDWREFLALPKKLYRNDPNWITPLYLERQKHLSAQKPYFEHGKMRAWLVYRDGVPVGRISAQIDALYDQLHTDRVGFFGLLEAEEDTEVFQALLTTAENWLREQGAERVRGPFNLSINEECGLLVEGFERPPMFMMNHNPPYYADELERCGYSGVKNMVAYMLDTFGFQTPKVMEGAVRKAGKNLQVRSLNRAKYSEDMEILRDIFNDAWTDNWGFVPFTKAEFHEIGNNLKFLLPDDYIQIAEIDGEAAAMIVILPDINEAIADLNGRLLPFGWLKLLWRLKVHHPSRARVALMGLRKQYHRTNLGTAAVYSLFEAIREPILSRNVAELELSWILEDNRRLRRILETLGAEVYKLYRIYEKVIVQ